MDEMTIRFAKTLVSPDKETRDKTCVSLVQFITEMESSSELEMLKLWKALYYCLWLADKTPVQLELATFLSKIFRQFPKKKLSVLCLRCFLRTMQREWTFLDQFRVEKFYVLMRLVLRESLSYLNENKWHVATSEQFFYDYERRGSLQNTKRNQISYL